jgi:hypothetical protein
MPGGKGGDGHGVEAEGRGSSLIGVGIALAVVVGGALAYRALAPPEPTTAPPSTSSNAIAGGPGRCAELERDRSFVVGEEASPKAQGEEWDRDDELAPFAVILGRAITFEGGFAVGVLGDGEGGSVANVVTLAADGTGGKTVRIGRSRGDFEPPVVAASKQGLLVALLEPNAGGRAVRVASVEGDKVTFGAEISEGNDESLAIDIVAGKERGIVAWDAVDDDTSFVSISTFPLDGIERATGPRRVTEEKTDAEAPRLVARPGGFFLTYLVRGHETRRERVVERGYDAGTNEDEVDETRGGEAVVASWIEVIALDESGAASGEPQRVTPRDGNVVTFDVVAVGDALLIGYRDEDSPTGAAGGSVRLARVTMGGVGEATTVADEEGSDGAPTLLPGWLAVPTLRGPDLLAKLTAEGAPAEALEPEASLGRAEPIAAAGARLLLAEPEGRAMRLRVVDCGDRPPTAAPAAPASSAP